MSVSCFSSNTRVNRVALTVTSPHMLLVRVLHQRTSDAADARSRAPRNSAHDATETPGTKRSAGHLACGSVLLLRLGPDATSACREASVSHSRCGELKGRLDTTAAYNQRGAGGSATGGLYGLVTQ